MKKLLIILCFFSSCVSTEKTLNTNVQNQLFLDTGYVKLKVPLTVCNNNNNSYDIQREYLREQGTLEISNIRFAHNYRRQCNDHKVTDAGKKYLVKEYKDEIDSSVSYAVLNFYRIKKLYLKDYRFLTSAHDSVEVIIEAVYDINRLYPVRIVADTPRIYKGIMKKTNGRWEIENRAKLLVAIYYIYNVEIGWEMGVVYPAKFTVWFDSFKKKTLGK